MLWQDPCVASRDCGDCERYLYDEKTGQRKQHGGLPMLRPRGIKTPCSTCVKVPEEERKSRHPATITSMDAVNLTEQNHDCYTHYLECKAVGVFPDDPLVRRHASLIRQLEDQRRRQEDGERYGELLTLLTMARGR